MPTLDQLPNYMKFDNASSDIEMIINNGVDKCQNLDYEEAIADFNQALRLNPNHKVAAFNKGRAMVEWGYKQVLDAHLLINSGFDELTKVPEMEMDSLQAFAHALQEEFRSFRHFD